MTVVPEPTSIKMMFTTSEGRLIETVESTLDPNIARQWILNRDPGATNIAYAGNV